ncbi:Putative WLM domain-containing protein [Septoria linicola]|uniref:WLM domain-containing protein n=1 Tax=Septoria linicola TaxID=215465 RepID=A0A9Q9B1J2_9PEZI|nr:putative WLM domain-containing protein [Septoria linicola]USW58955.1 Putative WLM domain-containing protein [Septoria linicola]
MPLGFERLNERTQRPNANINFIKTISTGADKAVAEEFLARIAAQCHPVMKKHYITVMALEEYPPNPEFLGRNFNAGEVIQLVLKDKQGRWLSFKFVQMVMMHELAHCKQMNHSKFFWAVRNDYAKQMEDLWKDKYEGEGMWGRGRGLQNGAFVHAQPPDNTQIPEHLCGGSYRRRGKKRKRGGQQGQDEGEQLSYAERQQKRIQKKLGKHGVSMKSQALGDDELTRGALERMNGGKRAAGKPRVANSKRGRELRASAALARFEAIKQQPPEKTPEKTPELVDDSETESEWEKGSVSGVRDDAIVIKDEHGRDMVKVCGDGEDDEEGAGREMDELRMLSRGSGSAKPAVQADHVDSETESEAEQDGEPINTNKRGGKNSALAAEGQRVDEDAETEDEVESVPSPGRPRAQPYLRTSKTAATDTRAHSPDPIDLLHDPTVLHNSTSKAPVPLADHRPGIAPPTGMLTCQVCSLENEPNSPTCMACSHVLCPRLVPNYWACRESSCLESLYLNAGDVGRCGVCGTRRQKPTIHADNSDRGRGVSSHAQKNRDESRAPGVTNPDVLRWD